MRCLQEKWKRKNPGNWKKIRRVWCHRSQGRKEFKREGVGVVDAFEAGKEEVVENSAVKM